MKGRVGVESFQREPAGVGAGKGQNVEDGPGAFGLKTSRSGRFCIRYPRKVIIRHPTRFFERSENELEWYREQRSSLGDGCFIFVKNEEEDQ